MVRALFVAMLGLAGATAWADDPCAGKVTAAVIAFDRDSRQGVGLLVNHCGQPVQAELLVAAHNRDGFPVARLRTTVAAGAAPISVIRVELPFVQSVIALSGYSTEVAVTETLRSARLERANATPRRRL
jgi:hypothetical protein